MEQILEEYPSIESLDFSNNLLSQVHSLEPCFKTLSSLNLSHNQIDFAAEGCSCLGELVNLKELKLNNNAIKTLSCSGLSKLHQLETLDLSFNRIENMA